MMDINVQPDLAGIAAEETALKWMCPTCRWAMSAERIRSNPLKAAPIWRTHAAQKHASDNLHDLRVCHGKVEPVEP